MNFYKEKQCEKQIASLHKKFNSLGKIISKTPLLFNTANSKLIAKFCNCTERGVQLKIKSYITAGLFTKPEENLYEITELGILLRDQIMSETKVKQTRTYNEKFRIYPKIIDGENLLAHYTDGIRKEKRTNILILKKELKDMNDSHDGSIQNLYEIFSKHLNQKPEHLETLVETRLKAKNYTIHNEFAYRKAILWNLILCGWNQIAFLQKELIKKAPEIYEFAIEYTEKLKKKVNSVVHYARKIFVQWYLSPRILEHKRKLVLAYDKCIRDNIRRKNAGIEAMKQRAAGIDFNKRVSEWFSLLSKFEQDTIDRTAPFPGAMFIRAARAAAYSNAMGDS